MQDFVNRQAKNVPVNEGKLPDRPSWGKPAYKIVKIIHLLGDSLHERPYEFNEVRGQAGSA